MEWERFERSYEALNRLEGSCERSAVRKTITVHSPVNVAAGFTAIGRWSSSGEAYILILLQST